MLKFSLHLAAGFGLIVLLASCSSPVPSTNSESPSAEVADLSSKLSLPAPCDGFDFPVGPPDGKGYYNAQKFGENTHLGDDWNGVGGGNSDLGDPVHVIADGEVLFAEDIGGGWGNVMRVLHNVGTKAEPVLLESLYGHLDSMWVKAGKRLQRGEQIGTIGNAHGAYWAHLHLEIRDSIDLPIGGGYSEETAGYLDPTTYIKAHRPGTH